MSYHSVQLFISLFVLFSCCICCGHVDNPCQDRIDYAQNNINDGIDLDLLFAPPTQEELEGVIAMWDTFDRSSDHVEIIEAFSTNKNRHVVVIRHEAENRNHFGGVVLPMNYDSTQSYPLMTWADGLSQDNPMVVLENGYGFGFANLLPDHFILLPSFRGQSLKTSKGIYCSDGFFGDAYDGATDDVLRFIQVAFDLYGRSIDQESLSIYGGSRGGTVALLAGIRYPQMSKVVSQSGPTQFHNRECYDRYTWQFKYQFLNATKPMAQLREKLLECSPLYFINRYQNQLLLVHGRNDHIVPLWNAQNIVNQVGEDNLKILFTNEGHRVGAGNKVAKWIRDFEMN